MANRDRLLVSRSLYQVGMITLISAIVWVVVGIYRINTQKTNVEVDKNLLTPINLELDEEEVVGLSKRGSVSEYVPSPSPSVILTPSIDVIAPPEASASENTP